MISLLLAAAAPAVKATAAAAAPLKAPVNSATAPPLQVPVAPAQQIVTQTWFQAHAGWLTHTLGALFVISALGLIILLALQTTKQEGLSGTIGGRVESAYGRPGAEEQLKRVTGVAAVAFVVIGTILSLTGI